MKEISIKYTAGLLIGLLLYLLLSCACTSTSSSSEKTLRPLNPSTAAHLCEVLHLGSEDERCQDADTSVIAFLPDIKKHYERATREQVDEEIGEYLVDCDGWLTTPSDGVFQHCYYDFYGDGTDTLEIVYQRSYPDNRDPNILPQDNLGGHVDFVGIADP